MALDGILVLKVMVTLSVRIPDAWILNMDGWTTGVGVGVGVTDGVGVGVALWVGEGDIAIFTPNTRTGIFLLPEIPDINNTCTKIINATITRTEKANRMDIGIMELTLSLLFACENIFFIFVFDCFGNHPRKPSG